MIEGIRINREVGRIFILDQSKRDAAMERKYIPIESAIKDKRLALVDDSVVRGHTSRKITEILKTNGAREVHFVSTFPEIKYPCLHGGVAFASAGELAINNFGGREGLRRFIGAESLIFSETEDLKEAGIKNGCFACVNGEYTLRNPNFKSVSGLGYKFG